MLDFYTIFQVLSSIFNLNLLLRKVSRKRKIFVLRSYIQVYIPQINERSSITELTLCVTHV